ncbi:MAG: hypothetical protein HY862_15000 [Chloroflexi bacterium]|nr:hypothetical protein [Chloroflexota bacterium]
MYFNNLRLFIVVALALTIAALISPIRVIGQIPEQPMRLGRGQAQDIEWSPDGTKLTVASRLGLWVYRSSFEDVAYLEIDNLKVASWSPDGSQIAVGDNKGAVYIWDISIGKRETFVGTHDEPITSLAWNPAGHIIAIGSEDNTVRIWDITTLNSLMTLEHSGLPTNLSWSPQGDMLATTSADNVLQWWDTSTGERLRSAQIEGSNSIFQRVEWSPNGQFLVSDIGDGRLRVWNSSTGKIFHELENSSWLTKDISWSPDGKEVSAIFFDGQLQTWNIESGNLIRTTTTNQLIDLAAWKPNNAQIAIVEHDTGAIHVMDGASLQITYSYYEHQAIVESVSWHPEQDIIAAGGYGVVLLWDSTSGNLLQHMEAITPELGRIQLDWNAQGNVLSAKISNDRQAIEIWNVDSSGLISTRNFSMDYVDQYAWSPDGETIALSSNVGASGIVWLYDSNTNSLEQLLGVAGPRRIGWNPKGQFVTVERLDLNLDLLGHIDEWDADTGSSTRSLQSSSPFAEAKLAWNPTGTLLTLYDASPNSQVYIIDFNNDFILQKFQASGSVQNVTWSPDGTMIAIAVDDEIQIWDATLENKLMVLVDQGDVTVLDMTWNKNSDYIASANDDGIVRVWTIK